MVGVGAEKPPAWAGPGAMGHEGPGCVRSRGMERGSMGQRGVGGAGRAEGGGGGAGGAGGGRGHAWGL